MKSIFYKEPINIEFNIYSFRKHGEAKLSKPKELKGLKLSFSVDYIPKKCKCGVFVFNGDAWIKHNDYFSQSMSLPPEDQGKGLEYLANKYCNKQRKTKFIYGDSFGDIVLRQEAWIVIKRLYNAVKQDIFVLDIKNEIIKQQEVYHGFQTYELMCTPMERFWEKVIDELKMFK
jgi:hypothetical protein